MESFFVKSKQLRNVLWDERTTPLVQGFKALSKQLSETPISSLLSPSDIQLGTFLAEGEFGQVYEGFFAQTKVAIKVLKAGANETTQEELKSEVGLMLQLNHPRIVRCYGLSLNPMRAVFELMKGGSLESQLREKRGGKTLKTTLFRGTHPATHVIGYGRSDPLFASKLDGSWGCTGE